MDNNQGMISCAIGCWLVAALGGALAAVLLMVIGGWTFVQGVFAGAVIFAVVGALISWIICKPLPAPGEVQIGASDDAAAKASAARSAAEAQSAKAASSSTTTAASSAAPAAAAEIKPSTQLAGQAELAERKGEWKYEGDGAKAKPAKKAPAKKAPAKKAAAKADAPAAAEGPGTKPATMDAAREGGPDNLKLIKGVGPKLEALLHSMGFYHFDQVAAWGADEVAWVDQNLEGFKGRVSRDDWVAQARILAAGGETEFSARSKK
ncbi:MAG: hypothetical protein AAFP16_17190 [Pseudomonadota bacterium]